MSVIVYQPDDGPELVFDASGSEARLDALEVMEEATGMTMSEVTDAMARGSAKGIRAFLFAHLWTPENPVSYKDMRPAVRQVEIRSTLDELLKVRETAEGLTDSAERARMIAALDEQIAERRAAGEVGKDVQPSADETSPKPSPAGRSARSGRTTRKR